jgi:hypothetical protein
MISVHITRTISIPIKILKILHYVSEADYILLQFTVYYSGHFYYSGNSSCSSQELSTVSCPQPNYFSSHCQHCLLSAAILLQFTSSAHVSNTNCIINIPCRLEFPKWLKRDKISPFFSSIPSAAAILVSLLLACSKGFFF